MRNPAAGTKIFQVQLLDERFNIIAETADIDRVITDSGRDNPKDDRKEDAERTNQGS